MMNVGMLQNLKKHRWCMVQSLFSSRLVQMRLGAQNTTLHNLSESLQIFHCLQARVIIGIATNMTEERQSPISSSEHKACDQNTTIFS